MLSSKNSGQQFFILILQTHLATPHQEVTVNLSGNVHNQHGCIIIPVLFLVRRKKTIFFHALVCWHKAGQPSSPCMPHIRNKETMGTWGAAVGGRWECLHRLRNDPRGQSARLLLVSLSRFTFSHSCRLSLSNHLCTSTAHQMPYGKYLGVTQSSVVWPPVKHGADTASKEANFGVRYIKQETKNTMCCHKECTITNIYI